MLGSYEPKVMMGFLLGIYGEEARENLMAIGQVRNKFAHRTNIRDFEHRELDPFFKKLTIYKRLKDVMLGRSFRGPFPDPMPDNARQRERFTACVRTLDSYFVLDPFNHAPIMPRDPKF